MAAKKCAREGCGKTVYPIEELKCLDKVWHKQCFKCTVCGMTLTMKNYKGYDKLPYCEPHYPKTVASVVADTPEMRRIAENTKNQSSIAYHADYEKMKGTKIEIADDPETQRHLSNTKTQSQIAYTGEQDKKKHQEEIRPQKISAQPSGLGRIVPPSVPEPVDEDLAPRTSTNNDTPYSSRLNQQGGTVIYSSEHGGRVAPEQRPVGSIADYDPLNGKWGTVANSGSPGTADKLSDIIVNCEKVDEGWMTGTVQRTLQWGMLPANYVEPYKQPTGLHRIK